MFPEVEVPAIDPSRYIPIVGEEAIARLRDLAAGLAGKQILQINSAAYGGGVAELLRTRIGLMLGLGIDATWVVLQAEPVFFEITKSVHNGLQGMEVPWGADQEGVYLRQLERVAQEMPTDADVVIVHDPQPCGFGPLLRSRRKGRWFWRCHIDTSTPIMNIWRFFAPQVATYDGAIFTDPSYVPPGIEDVPVTFIRPSIDPLSPKNAPLDPAMVRALAERYRLDVSRPILTQISRFDPWKDPIGVIDAYRIVKAADAGVQLVLAGSQADDDPQGAHVLELARAHAGGDPDVRLLTDADGIGDVEVNAFQRAATVAVQKSTREGFGLTVSEAMWKGKPVVGGDVGGIRAQIQDGITGFLVDSVESCADRIGALLAEPLMGQIMGQRATEVVRRHFLCIRELEEELRLISEERS